MNEIVLKIEESPQQHVGRGRAIIDPKIIEDQKWNSGQILELTYNKKTHVKLWPGAPEEYGSGIIKIDGMTRLNIGAGIGDKISLKTVEAVNADQIVLSPTEKIAAEGLQEYMIYNYLNHVFTTGDSVSLNTQMGGRVQFIVTSTKPSKPVLVTENTVFKLGAMTKAVDSSVPRITYDELGGLKKEVQKIREMVELPMRHPELFDKIGVEAPKGVLLYGPPGTGKTLLAKAVAGETNAHFISLSGPEIMGKHYGESEERIREIFTQAEENAPSIIFIDEIDSIAPKRDEVSGELEKRIVSQLLTLMDGMKSRGKVVVIAATNRPDSIDPALRRPGRFDREFEISVPNEDDRLEILEIHTRDMPMNENIELKDLSSELHGYTGADIKSLCREAALKSIRRYLPEIDLETEKIPSEVLQSMEIKLIDFYEAMHDVIPTAMREVYVERSKVWWQDVGGLDDIKRSLTDNLVTAMKDPTKFTKMGIRPPKGALIYGPPGCGKTLLARALATETGANMNLVKGPEILSKWVGESEKAIREVFRKAKASAPCVVIFDELDSLARNKSGESGVGENILSQLLTEIEEGISSQVVVIGITNRPDILDSSLLRTGRLDLVLYVSPPDEKGRLEIIKILTKKMPLTADVKLQEIAVATQNYTGADLAALCREAVVHAMQNNSEKISSQDFSNSLKQVRPSITKEVDQWYNKVKESISNVVPKSEDKSFYG